MEVTVCVTPVGVVGAAGDQEDGRRRGEVGADPADHLDAGPVGKLSVEDQEVEGAAAQGGQQEGVGGRAHTLGSSTIAWAITAMRWP